MKKIWLALLAGVMLVMVMGGSVSAAGNCNNGATFLGLRAWYYDLEISDRGGGCTVVSPRGNNGTSVFVWKIILNVLYDLFVIVGYLAIGFIIFGGYTYLLARGDTGRIEKGKKTIISAVSGLIIAMLASLVVSFISGNIIFGSG